MGLKVGYTVTKKLIYSRGIFDFQEICNYKVISYNSKFITNKHKKIQDTKDKKLIYILRLE